MFPWPESHKLGSGLRRERTVGGEMSRPPGRRAPIRSTPGSPVHPGHREPHPLHWFVRDIDIGDGPPSDTRSDTGALMTRSVSSVTRSRSRPHYMMPLQRTRSRHDCNFIPGTPFLNTGKVLFASLLLSHIIFMARIKTINSVGFPFYKFHFSWWFNFIYPACCNVVDLSD